MAEARRASMWQLIRQSGSAWLEDKAPKLGAALSYYAAFSIPPLLVIALAIAAIFFGDQAADSAVDQQLRGLLGEQGASGVKDMVTASRAPQHGIISTLVGVAALLFAASGVFGELQDSLNIIWKAKPKTGTGIWGFIKGRFLSFAMVLGVGFLLLISLVLSAILSALGTWMQGVLPAPPWVMQLANFCIAFLVITLLFAMIFKLLPDTAVAWRDVWVGAVVTAALFSVGKFALGLYLGQSALGSSYGAAGSLVILLVWVYYSAQILFLGAEFTRVFAEMYGSRVGKADASETGPNRPPATAMRPLGTHPAG